MSSKLDMTAMYATYRAQRRDLEHIARITAHSNGTVVPDEVHPEALPGRGCS